MQLKRDLGQHAVIRDSQPVGASPGRHPRVLLLLPRVQPSANGVLVGGAVNSVLNLVKGLKDASHITILTSASPGQVETVRRLLPSGVAASILGIDAVPQTSRYGLKFLAKAASWAIRNRRLGFDVIHGHSGYAVYAWATLGLAAIFRAKSVHTVYCPLASNATVYNKQSLSLGRSISVAALKRLDQVLGMTHNVAESLVAAGLASATAAVLPIAVDTDKYFPRRKDERIRRRLGADPDTKLLVFVGSLSFSKGLDVLLVALRTVADRFPKVRLIFTLEHDHESLSERAKAIDKLIETSRLEPYIQRLGFVDFMPDVLAQADIVISPYRDTQGPSDYPLALMEAMACGSCVVGTTVGGIPELITDGDNGRLVKPNAPNELAQAIIELLLSPETIQRMGERAAARMLQRYAVRTSSDAHLQRYASLLGHRADTYAA